MYNGRREDWVKARWVTYASDHVGRGHLAHWMLHHVRYILIEDLRLVVLVNNCHSVRCCEESVTTERCFVSRKLNWY